MRIGVSAHAVSLLQESRWRGAALTVLAEQAFAPSAEHPYDAIAQALRALLAEQPRAGWPVQLVLADDLVRMWRVVPPATASRLADLEAAAGLRFQSLYGESPANWQISADWSASAPFFAAAVPRDLLKLLQLVAQEHALHIVSIEPQFVAALNRWRRALRPGAWFALVHDGLLSIAAIETEGAAKGGLRAIRSVPLAAGQGADQFWLAQAVRREALLLDMPAPELLQVCGSAPAVWSKPVSHASHLPCVALDHAEQFGGTALSSIAQLARSGSRQSGGRLSGGRLSGRRLSGWASMQHMKIDFAAASVRRSLFHTSPALLLLAGAGLLLCVTALSAGWQLSQQQRARAAQLQQVQQRAAALSQRPAEVAQVAIPPAQAQFVNGAIGQLNLPWRDLQDAVAAATPRQIALLALDPDPRKQVLKLTAEAKTSDDMVAYVAELKQQELFGSVTLTRHEINDQDPNRPLRFQVEAIWVTP